MATIALKKPRPRPQVEPDAVLNALATAIVVVDAEGAVVYVNAAAENFFKNSAAHLAGQALNSLLPADGPLFSLIGQVRGQGISVAEYGVTLHTPTIGTHEVNIQAAPLHGPEDLVMISLREHSITELIDRQLTHRDSARSVSAMAAMLAHEVKNPLSGIRGAAQLLEQNAGSEDRLLTRLICDETDRICALVDRMDVFTDRGLAMRGAVNIHRVLNRVQQVAENGFAKGVRFATDYDPSLPSVLGGHDQLVQIFLNLIKNAAEALPRKGGEITLATAYKHGVRFAAPGGGGRVHLPLMVSVKDNGRGIPDDIKDHLFDPFVTSKPGGSGLGLALVAKLVRDHGGVIEFSTRPRCTRFKVMLPMAATAERES